MTDQWTASGKPIPYPTGQVSACVLCGEVGGATWDELVLCGKCEGEMAASLREPTGFRVCERCNAHIDEYAPGETLCGACVDEDEAPTRHCADCGETFTPLTDHAIRCRECAAVKYLG